MATIETIIGVVDMLALVALAVGVSRLKLSSSIHVQPTATVTAPAVQVTVQPSPPAVVRLLVPADIIQDSPAAGTISAMGAHRAHVLHRNPNGLWQRIGEIECGDREDKSTWSERLKAELGAEGRAIEWPDGEIQEHA